jgi:hypothetical protein
MGILSTIFGSGKVIEKGFDLINSFHTSETELIEAKTKAKTKILEAYAPFKIAQRYLAIMFAITFLLSFVLVLGLTLAGVGNITDVRAVLSEFYIGEIMFTIIGFYFGGGFFEGVMSSRKPKKKTKKEDVDNDDW